MTTLVVDGEELFYSTRGEGPVCLVLSAIGARPYEIQMPAQMSAGRKLVFVELRGSGRSTADPAGLTLDRLAVDLEALRAELGAERVAVLGHSILGVLALEYGRRCPATVSHVIAVGTPPYADMARLSTEARAFFERQASADRKRALEDKLAALPAGASLGEVLLAHTPMRFFEAGLDAAPLFAGSASSPRFFAHLLGSLTAGWEVTRDSGALRVPLLIALGRHDYVTPWPTWDGIAERLPDATVEIFERSGHQPFFEEPDRFARVVTEWMSESRE